jgi:hypothetical protein
MKAGWSILRFIREEQSPNTRIRNHFYNAYNFIAVNLATEDITFTYLVPKNGKPAQIIKDLQELAISKKWMDVELVEKNGVLQIKSMRELKNSQMEYEEMKMRIKRRLQ